MEQASTTSYAALLASLPVEQQRAELAKLTPAELASLPKTWRFWARPNQLPPVGDWSTWVVMAGRGFGKTRVGAEWVREQAMSGRCKRLAIVGATAADVRQVMVEGESGILAVHPDDERPLYEPSKRELTWPNGAMATTYSADEPERLRGPQHDGAWCDEVGAWRYPEAWDMLLFGLRLGADPRCVVTTTPRPTAFIRGLVKEPGTVLTRGSTYDNLANLAPTFRAKIISKYEGTRLGRQELNGELLEDVEGALWKPGMIDPFRVERAPSNLLRIVVAIDPAVTATDDSDETGIVAAGLGANGHFYVLDDKTDRYSPAEWATVAVSLLETLQGDRIVAEVNQGGDMVETVLRNVAPQVPYTAVRATRGKVIRAEPIAALYEQGRVHHVGMPQLLEAQLCNFVPGMESKSPDRLDALVWALTELSGQDEPDDETIGLDRLMPGYAPVRLGAAR